GEAERILQAARAYKEQTVAEATGQAARFLSVYEQYKKAPEITRKRMYLETMERILGGTDKIILDSKGGQSVVPYLSLDQLHKPWRASSFKPTMGVGCGRPRGRLILAPDGGMVQIGFVRKARHGGDDAHF